VAAVVAGQDGEASERSEHGERIACADNSAERRFCCNDFRVIAVLAQHAQNSPSPWWLALAVPMGVVTGAITAGLFSLRTSRKSPYDRLEQLVGVLKDWPEDWPEGQPSKETVHHAIELTTSEIRRSEAFQILPPSPRRPETMKDSEAELKAQLLDRLGRSRSADIGGIAFIFASLAAILIGGFAIPWLLRDHPDLRIIQPFVAFVAGSVIVGAVAGILPNPHENARDLVIQMTKTLRRTRAWVRTKTEGASPGEDGEAPNRDQDATESSRQAAPARPPEPPASSQLPPAATAPPQT
jgi:hypothetical protein